MRRVLVPHSDVVLLSLVFVPLVGIMRETTFDFADLSYSAVVSLSSLFALVRLLGSALVRCALMA